MIIPPRVEWLQNRSDGRAWLDRLPQVIEDCVEQWGLELGEPYPSGMVSLTIPATRGDGSHAVLKVQWPHRECTHEAAALRSWQGDGAVRLIDHDPDRHALLLERCTPGTQLYALDPEEATGVVIGLLRRLLVPTDGPFDTLADEATQWIEALPQEWERAGRPFERRLVDAAIEALRDLSASQGPPVLLHQDLHAGNVLAAEREPWLAIDPKPLVGERDFAAAPVIRSWELGHTERQVHHRLDRLRDELGLDRDRAKGWALGQTVAWTIHENRALPKHVETAQWLVD